MPQNREHSRPTTRHLACLLLLALAVSAASCKERNAPPAGESSHDSHETNAHDAHDAKVAPAAKSTHDHAGHEGHDAQAATVAPGGNVVQAEMRLLNEALRDSVTAIGYGQLGAIPEALHRVHHAREQTEHALEAGSYTLRKNAGDVKAFRALDEAFHGELEKLVEKANANDPAGVGTQLGVVLSKCDGCHSRFRP